MAITAETFGQCGRCGRSTADVPQGEVYCQHCVSDLRECGIVHKRVGQDWFGRAIRWTLVVAVVSAMAALVVPPIVAKPYVRWDYQVHLRPPKAWEGKGAFRSLTVACNGEGPAASAPASEVRLQLTDHAGARTAAWVDARTRRYAVPDARFNRQWQPARLDLVELIRWIGSTGADFAVPDLPAQAEEILKVIDIAAAGEWDSGDVTVRALGKYGAGGGFARSRRIGPWIDAVRWSAIAVWAAGVWRIRRRAARDEGVDG